MTLFLAKYLTEYDDSLTTESYIDPVGTLIIWSAFGRQVFKNHINSISNDVRNYTLNMFHHCLIRKLVNDDEATLSVSLQRKYLSKDALPFKQACLIFLENLFVYSALQHERMSGLETAGILGISKARRPWDKSENDPTIIFTHERPGQILVRQLSLGVSGRYKTPLMEIGLFDASYQYNRPAFLTRWAGVEEFIARNRAGALGKLERIAYSFLKECVAELRHGGNLPFGSGVSPDLKKAYVRAFASPALVGSYARDFWLQQTGLDSGASGALYRVLTTNSESHFDSRLVLEEALHKDELQPEERVKLEQIVQLEPFLSDCALLFTLMAAERTHSVTAVEAQWARFGRNTKRLPDLAQQIQGYATLPAVKGSEAARRLMQLQQVANAGSFDQQVRALANYHGSVMQSRGQLAWLSVEQNGTIKLNARTMLRPSPKEWPRGAWHNHYYIPQFRSFVMGLQGISA